MSEEFNGKNDGTAFRSRLSKGAFEYCRELRQSLSACFTYEPDIHTIVNAILLTGKFSADFMVQNIRETFATEPEKPENQFEAKVIKSALESVRRQKGVLSALFRYPPDIHMVVNVMIVTAELDTPALVENIRQAFLEPYVPAIPKAQFASAAPESEPQPTTAAA
jgi:hypothetical protein